MSKKLTTKTEAIAALRKAERAVKAAKRSIENDNFQGSCQWVQRAATEAQEGVNVAFDYAYQNAHNIRIRKLVRIGGQTCYDVPNTPIHIDKDEHSSEWYVWVALPDTQEGHRVNEHFPTLKAARHALAIGMIGSFYTGRHL